MTQPDVVLYGASGYTGKLVARQLAARGIPFVAAGRNGNRLKAELGALPELDEASYEIAEVSADEAALTELLRDRKVVYNTVGPFMQLGEPVVRAALAAGCHYLDSTGEQDWMLHTQRAFGRQFAERDLLLIPALSMMWASGNLVAELCLETPGVDSLDILYVPRGSTPSVGSTLSFLRMCCQPQYRLVDNELVQWPAATSFQATSPGIHRTLDCLPWSGGGEPVWFAEDERVRHCETLVSFGDPNAMAAVLNLTREFADKYAHLPAEEQEAATNNWGHQMAASEPPRDDANISRTIVSCQGRGLTGGVSAVLWGNCGYDQTGVIAAGAIERLLRERHRAVGFVSPAHAFGARPLLSEWSEAGLVEFELR
ncbi:saccharopine dehydrogenase family protein [Streptomyces sp. UG1]|uniref:saccharopine dehydrogenase family protein n=1 Tax=Streptomyces sp. UG1 TaxID=3417652 RepID=UPI003CF71A27